MTHETTLTLKIAREWDGNTSASLRKYTSIEVEAAEALAGYEAADLELVGLNSLSLPVAMALAKQKSGSVSLSGLTSIREDVAEEFSRYKGYLGLEGLTSLSVSAAQSLSKSVQSLNLSGLTTVSDPVAEVLAKCKCHITLCSLTELTHPGLAAKLAEIDDEVNLPGLTELYDPVATALAQTKAELILTGLKSTSNFDLAWKLFTQQKYQDDRYLSSLTSLSTAEAATLTNYDGSLYLGLTSLTDGVAKELAKHNGELFLNSLTALSDIAAEEFSRHEGALLELKGLSSLSDIAAEALSKKSKGYLSLTPALSKKVCLCRYTRMTPVASQTSSSEGTIKAIDLQHGKLYDCTMDGYLGPEDCRFVQLAIDATSNRRFMLLGAKHSFAEDSSFVHKLINMSFSELASEDFDGEPSRTSGLQVWESILDENGLLKSKAYDCHLSAFKEVELNNLNKKS